ncbi:MAG: hypothetical protein ACJZ8Y_10115 [Pirellulaceae bacterium]|tara:strand:- start:9909 stop:12647 length:2739 start_codon:yes stop_codon:yes gene_type:complete
MRTRSDFLGRDGYTWWVGEVESNEDPSQLGRVKVRVIGWYTGEGEQEAYTNVIKTEDLPWATVLLPTDKPQTKNAGSTSELQPGSMVLGFFLDGDEGQMPCVLGAFRGFKDQTDPEARTVVADAESARKQATKTPGQDDMAGNKRMDGNPFVKVQSTTPGSATGTLEETRGGISTAEQILPGNAVTNPIKPPVSGQSVADGVGGPGGEGFETDVERMLTELGEMAATSASGPGGFVSLATGSKLAGDKVREHLGKICNFLAGGISGILAPLKELLAKIIAEVINALVKIISKFIPLGVINAILSLVQEIFAIFCMETPMWLGLVQSAISDTVNFANKMASFAVDKVAKVIDQAIGGAVKEVTGRILEGITKAMDRVKSVAGDVISAVQTAKQAAGAARSLGKTVSQIFEIDFTTLDWGSLMSIIKMILGLLFQKDCGRKIKRPKVKRWYPLIGTTECDNVHDALVGSPYNKKVNDAYKNKSGLKGGSFIDNLFSDINPWLQETVTHLNGAKEINDATPGKEKKIVSGPGGVSSFQDAYGNEHVNVPNNQTKIIAKDKCETIKGNYVLTVEGDFYLKVMGNFHEEVTGAKNEHSSNGPQAESKGKSKSPDTSTTGGATKSADTNVTSAATSSDTFKKNPTKVAKNLNKDIGSDDAVDNRYKNNLDKGNVKERERMTILKYNNVGGFYPVDKIPYHPDADEWGRTPHGPQLSGELKDDKEQKSAQRKEGDHEIAYTGEVKIQGSKVKITGIEGIQLNAQTVKTEANTIENVADGEIINEANWITSFLNAGRFEFVAIFNPFAALTGQFSLVKGAIIDIATDTPFPAVAPPTHTRICVTTSVPGSMNDIIAGTTSGVHNTFIAAPSGVITEFVTAGNIMNQVVTGMASYSVGTGYMATGCGFGPHQVYGLPLLLN